jgi:hypothetical protein
MQPDEPMSPAPLAHAPTRPPARPPTSREAASPTLTVGLSPGSPSWRPTNPFGLLGASGSSSQGFMMPIFCPASLVKK